MTTIGWVQILIYCAIIVAITPVLGGYMTRVFNGERTFLTPILRPVELALYSAAGVDEKREQRWLTYVVAMLLFHRPTKEDPRKDGYKSSPRPNKPWHIQDLSSKSR